MKRQVVNALIVCTACCWLNTSLPADDKPASTSKYKSDGKVYHIVTDDGILFVGVIVDRDNKRLVVDTSDGKKTKIPLDQIEEIKAAQAGGGRRVPAGFRVKDEPVTSDKPDARTIRLLLLLPGGPIVLDANVTIDGRPFRELRDEYIDRRLQAADRDNDGKVSVVEAVADGKLFASRFPYVQKRNREARLAALKKFDADKDGAISKSEARKIVAEYGGGAAVSLLNAAYRSSMARVPVRELLDTNNDGSIDEQEIAVAAARLKSRDSDDNGILYISELSGVSGRSPSRVTVQATSLIVYLSHAADWQAVELTLRSRYGGDVVSTERHFQLAQRLGMQLDKNFDGIIGRDELAALLQVAPQLRVEAHFGRTGDLPKGITLMKSISDELQASERATSKLANTVMIELPGTHLQLTGSKITRNFTNFQAQAKAYMRFDANKNSYLERAELNNQTYLLQVFEQADEDGNQMVFADELENYFRRGVELQMNRISVAAADQGDSLFDALDANGDGRLSAREMRYVGERLKNVDKDGDGTITFDEIPTTIHVALARGSYAAQALNIPRRYSGVRRYTGRSTSPYGQVRAPRWFRHMDRNDDGDVAPREFLGNREQFDELDTNGDGFIEPKEAEAAGESPSSDD